MPLSAARRVLLGAAAVAVTAGVGVAVQRAQDGAGSSHGAVTALARASATYVGGYELAGALSQTSAIRTSPGPFDGATLASIAAQQNVDTRRAWPLKIPGDDQTAWLFAGSRRLALVVPRTVTDPRGEPQPDALSVFGARIADLADQPLVASQAGGGQAPRTLVLVPAGVEPPRIVRHDGEQPIRSMPHSGRLYADRIRPGEQLVVGSRRIGPLDAR